MVQVNRRYEEVKRAKDEASAQLSEKADEAKFFLWMSNIAINFIDQSYHQTISFAANAMQLIINEQSQQHEKLLQ